MSGHVVEDVQYRIKRIQFGANSCGIVLQDENGPCPVLAIANTLLLRGAICLHPDLSFVSHNQLIELLTGYVHDVNRAQLSESSGASEEVITNLRANLAEGISVLQSRAVRYGMNINCSLININSFEFTAETGLFDLLRIRLVHGWVCSPDEKDIYDFFAGKMYNKIQDDVSFYAPAFVQLSFPREVFRYLGSGAAS